MTNRAKNEEPGAPSHLDPSEHWLLTADHRTARLLKASLIEHGRLHLALCGEVAEEWDELQHDRPSPRAGKDRHAYASMGHEDEERAHRFAKNVAAWLEGEVNVRGIEQIHAFTGPRFLGQLRGVLPPHLHDHLTEHALNLGHLTPGELAVHQAVLEAIASAARP